MDDCKFYIQDVRCIIFDSTSRSEFPMAHNSIRCNGEIFWDMVCVRMKVTLTNEVFRV